MEKFLKDLGGVIKDSAQVKMIKTKIRERAIKQVQADLIRLDKTIKDFSEDDFEVLVQEAEAQLHDKIKGMTIAGILAFFGITSF